MLTLCSIRECLYSTIWFAQLLQLFGIFLQAYAVGVLSFGCLLQGFSIGFFVPGFRCLVHGTTWDFYGNPFKLSLDDAAWITGLLNLGAALGYLGAVMITDSVGRKKVVLANTLLYLIGYLTTFLAHEPHQLMVGR